MSEPMLGIGLPVRNGARYLPDLLAAVRKQDFADFELLVCDNDSTDETGDIVRAAMEDDPRIRYVCHPENIGVSANFNYALTHSRGEYFAWLAADDRFDPRFYARCVAMLAERPDAVAAFTQVSLFDDDGNDLGVVDERIPRADDPDIGVRFAELASFRHYCQFCFGVLRRSAAVSTRLLLPFWGSDRLFLAELALRGPLLRDPETLFFIRQHEQRVTARISTKRDRTAFYESHGGTRAVALQYAVQLRRAIDQAPLSVFERSAARQAYAGWLVRNSARLARSAARAAIERFRR